MTFETMTKSHMPKLRPKAPSGWEEIIHPEGGRYFYNHKMVRVCCSAKTDFLTKPNDHEQRVFTDADLHNPRHYQKVMADLDIIENFMAKHAILLPDSCQLVVDLFITGETIEMKYYFVNHRQRSIFHFDSYIVEPWIDTPGRLGEPFFLNVTPDVLMLYELCRT